MKCLRWFLMIQTAIKTCVFWWVCVCHLCIPLQRNGHCDSMRVLIGYFHSKGSLIINPQGTVCGPNLSLTTEVTSFSVFPQFWKYLSMILVQELLMTVSVAYIDSLSVLYMQAMILTRSYRLWGLAITSVDGCCLYIIIHNCILHGTWL